MASRREGPSEIGEQNGKRRKLVSPTRPRAGNPARWPWLPRATEGRIKSSGEGEKWPRLGRAVQAGPRRATTLLAPRKALATRAANIPTLQSDPEEGKWEPAWGQRACASILTPSKVCAEPARATPLVNQKPVLTAKSRDAQARDHHRSAGIHEHPRHNRHARNKAQGERADLNKSGLHFLSTSANSQTLPCGAILRSQLRKLGSADWDESRATVILVSYTAR